MYDIDTETSPLERGKVDAGRGAHIDECPYFDPENIRLWQKGWRMKQKYLKELRDANTSIQIQNLTDVSDWNSQRL